MKQIILIILSILPCILFSQIEPLQNNTNNSLICTGYGFESTVNGETSAITPSGNALFTAAGFDASGNYTVADVDFSTSATKATGFTTNLYGGSSTVAVSSGQIVDNLGWDASGNLVYQTPVTPNVITFTSSGTYTPSTGMKYCVVEIMSGGGGGMGADATTSSELSIAPGGASGTYARAIFTATQIGASKSVTIGAGGTGGTGAGSGGTPAAVSATVGGTTTFGIGANQLTAIGGGSGTVLNSNVTGPMLFCSHTLGGNVTVSGGLLQLVSRGVPSTQGAAQLGSSFVTGQISKGGISPFSNGSSSIVSSFLISSVSAFQVSGGNGTANTGSGGDGGVSIAGGTSTTGGNGGSGFCRVTEFF